MSNAEQALVANGVDRRQPRTHLFVAATMYSDGGSVPVHVRNMSPMGALIEGPAIPETDSAIVLKRGTLQATGKIAWKVGRKAGVAFSAAVSVSDWMPRQASRQGRVDQIVSEFKSSTQSGQGLSIGPNELPASKSVASQLLTIRSELTQVGASLADDLTLVARHPDIQLLDICLQRLNRLIEQLDRPSILRR